jgi:hypothetical protein
MDTNSVLLLVATLTGIILGAVGGYAGTVFVSRAERAHALELINKQIDAEASERQKDADRLAKWESLRPVFAALDEVEDLIWSKTVRGDHEAVVAAEPNTDISATLERILEGFNTARAGSLQVRASKLAFLIGVGTPAEEGMYDEFLGLVNAATLPGSTTQDQLERLIVDSAEFRGRLLAFATEPVRRETVQS